MSMPGVSGRQVSSGAALLTFGLALGCVPALQMQRRGATIPPKQMAMLPADLAISEVDADGKLTPNLEWSALATKNVVAALEEMTFMAGVSSYDAIASHSPKRGGAAYEEFRRWSDQALDEIAGRWLGRSHLDRQAEFALLVDFRDAHETPGLIVQNSLVYSQGGVLIEAQQVGTACLVDLKDGRMDWCQVRVDKTGDLRTPTGASWAVQKLLRDVLPVRGQNPS